jgi:fructose-1,6-bisphosphatase I
MVEAIGVKVLTTDTDPLTLTRRILEDQRHMPEARGDFTIILSSIQLACKYVSNAVRKAGIANLLGSLSSENTHGETQKKLDVLANDIFINSLKFSTKIAVMASEEEDDVYIVSNSDEPKYIIAFDPLDGSSNVEANISVGSIFAIWRRDDISTPGSASDFLGFKGKRIVAAGYCLYGGSTQMVLAIGGRVDCYTLDNAIGEFILTTPNIRVPERGSIYSINEGNSAHWDPAITEFVRRRKNPALGEASTSLRYVGSMVADVHRTMLYGGTFLYPADIRNPKGKLRVLYEVFPMSYIIESAGGRATDGKNRILDIEVTGIHMKSPVALGSSRDIAELEALYAEL